MIGYISLANKISFLRELRELAATHHKEKIRNALKIWADQVDLSLKEFESCPSKDNLTNLIGIWNRAILFFELVSKNDDPSGKGGKMPVPKYDKISIEGKKKIA